MEEFLDQITKILDHAEAILPPGATIELFDALIEDAKRRRDELLVCGKIDMEDEYGGE